VRLEEELLDISDPLFPRPTRVERGTEEKVGLLMRVYSLSTEGSPSSDEGENPHRNPVRSPLERLEDIERLARSDLRDGLQGQVSRKLAMKCLRHSSLTTISSVSTVGVMECVTRWFRNAARDRLSCLRIAAPKHKSIQLGYPGLSSTGQTSSPIKVLPWSSQGWSDAGGSPGPINVESWI